MLVGSRVALPPPLMGVVPLMGIGAIAPENAVVWAGAVPLPVATTVTPLDDQEKVAPLGTEVGAVTVM